MKRVTLALTLALAAGLSAQAADAQTLKTVKDRGMLSCGVSQGLPGFSSPDDKGNWTGLDVDVCRAIAAAIFNDPTKVKFVPLSAKDRFTALQSGEIDVLSRNTTWTISRDTSLGANFTGVTYYDGQGFMVKKSLKVNSALELNSASVCVQTGTTTELNLADYFKANNMKYEVIAFGTNDETVKAYEAGRCDVFTTDLGPLCQPPEARQSRRSHGAARDHLEGAARPDGAPRRRPMVRHREMDAVCHGHCRRTRHHLEERRREGQIGKPELKRVLGTDGNFGEQLGLTKDWVVADRQGGRQLRRGVRSQCRRRLAAWHQPRPQPALDQGRHPVRAADPLIAPTAGQRR